MRHDNSEVTRQHERDTTIRRQYNQETKRETKNTDDDGDEKITTLKEKPNIVERQITERK